jgi:hemoglobin/transferrin/lactoferrin receptor protein
VFSDVTTPDQNTVRYDGEELPTVTNKNLGDRWVYGSALDTKFKLNSSLELIGNLTFTGADHNTNYGPMPSISPLFGSFALSYSKARFQIRSQLQFSTSKDPSNFSLGGEDGLEETPLIDPYATLLTAQHAGAPAWSDLSILTNYQWSEKVNLKAGLENLFDIHYRTFASGVSAPGRSFRLGLQVQL